VDFLYCRNWTAQVKKCYNCLNTNIFSYLETPGSKSYNLYLNNVNFLTPVLIRHLWQLKTVVFLHRCLIRAVLLAEHCSTLLPVPTFLTHLKLFFCLIWAVWHLNHFILELNALLLERLLPGILSYSVNHRHLSNISIIDCLMAHIACLVCLISTVNGQKG